MTFPFDRPKWDKSIPTCILTGIRVLNYDLVARADLHLVNDAFILNCVTTNDGETFWSNARPLDLDPQVCSINITHHVTFERRGVIVLARNDQLLSVGSINYMCKAPQ